MKSKIPVTILFLPVIVALIAGLAVMTNFFSNALMLMMDRVNFIPEESSIFSFSPYEINQGSSSYWIYGEYGGNYYYF
ncbi:hypothetical protein FA471_14770, partial [Pseudomonas aeruginosa]|nr:hypothetical protein [Pseudomonas aeruginosa]